MAHLTRNILLLDLTCETKIGNSFKIDKFCLTIAWRMLLKRCLKSSLIVPSSALIHAWLIISSNLTKVIPVVIENKENSIYGFLLSEIGFLKKKKKGNHGQFNGKLDLIFKTSRATQMAVWPSFKSQSENKKVVESAGVF